MRPVYLFLAFSLFANASQAQQPITVSLGGSTLGATLEAGYRLGPNFGLRGIAGFGQANFESDFKGAPLIGTAHIGGVGILADVYFGGGGRITAGGIVPNYEATLAVTGDISVEGSAFSNVDIAGSISTVNRFAPIVAIGYERVFRNHWGVSADFGAMYTGGFFITATDNSTQIPQIDLDSELSTTNAELGQITILPFVKLGVSFAF
ncbi:MAG: hypothetical protein COB08_008245 [Rhodobacteraceae bacterium]|nr:hypothetical protein [Paracoccaceae bacterium]